MKKAVSVLRWHSIDSKIKPKSKDKCLTSDVDGNIRVAIYEYFKKTDTYESGYYFVDLLSRNIDNYVYCWAKIPEILYDAQLNNIDAELLEEYKEVNNSERTKVIMPTEMRCSKEGIVVYTETRLYKVVPTSQAKTFLWGSSHRGPFKVTLNKDGYIYHAENVEE